jgi:hypothetical protein
MTIPREAPDIPLLLPDFRADFSWNGRSASVFAQRLLPGSEHPHQRHFYVRSPEGQYHETDYLKICRQLTHPPRSNTVQSIALAFEREPHQHDESTLPDLLNLCRP